MISKKKKKNFMLILLQGRGSYEDRMEMLRLIVDLVEASMYADNPEWRLDVWLHLNVCRDFAL